MKVNYNFSHYWLHITVSCNKSVPKKTFNSLPLYLPSLKKTNKVSSNLVIIQKDADVKVKQNVNVKHGRVYLYKTRQFLITHNIKWNHEFFYAI